MNKEVQEMNPAMCGCNVSVAVAMGIMSEVSSYKSALVFKSCGSFCELQQSCCKFPVVVLL